jgi:hypothetical protein
MTGPQSIFNSIRPSPISRCFPPSDPLRKRAILASMALLPIMSLRSCIQSSNGAAPDAISYTATLLACARTGLLAAQPTRSLKATSMLPCRGCGFRFLSSRNTRWDRSSAPLVTNVHQMTLCGAFGPPADDSGTQSRAPWRGSDPISRDIASGWLQALDPALRPGSNPFS